jgi:hypothetical protein
LQLLAELVAELRGEFEQKVAELEERPVRALSETKQPSGEVIDLPNPFKKRVA